ncbi:hypothetical protein JAAARDRAFT_112856, partial [Jaapia argillacea MUCL 33604]
LSSSQLKMILWIMGECGAKDVPSFKAFRKLQGDLRDRCGVRTECHKSDLGNVFYSNDIRDLIQKDFANPEVARNINIYPEVPDGPISEFWQADYMKGLPWNQLTPSYFHCGKHFYIDELCELEDGHFVIP